LLTNAVLVVNIVNLGHIEAFLRVQRLLIMKNSLVEEHLKLLVAVVDAELLEAVHWEVLCKSKIGVIILSRGRVWPFLNSVTQFASGMVP
jgi:hypothetical protein